MADFCDFIVVFVILACFLPSPINGVGFELHHHFIGKSVKGRVLLKDKWCYDEPDCKEGSPDSDWEMGVCKTGQRQSPIDISPLSTLTLGPCPIDFGMTPPSAYDFNDYEIHNLGETLKIELKGNSEAFFRYPAKNNGKYKLLQIHFHWGETDSEGSEHLLGGKPFSAEMHLVHYSTEYDSAGSAIKSGSGDALAVIGFGLQVDPGATDSFLQPLTDSVFDKVPNLEDKAELNIPWGVSGVLLEQSMAYAYEGEKLNTINLKLNIYLKRYYII